MTENFAIETRIMKVKGNNTKLDGRYIEGFVGNKVTKELVDEVLRNSTIKVGTIEEATTIVTCVLPNSFTIIETSSAMTKENYSEEIGVEECMKRIKDKVWELLGFLYMTGLNGFKSREEVEKEVYEDIIDEALSLAFDEILEEELSGDIDYLVENNLYQKYKAKAIASIQAELKANLVDIVKGEELSLDDLVELIIALHMATRE